MDKVAIPIPLSKLTKAQLIKQCKDIYAEKVAVLGEGDCFIRRNGKGFVESVRVPVNLHHSKGEIYQIGERWGISADGYDKLNQAAGLSVVAPRSIFVGGVESLQSKGFEVGNPYFETHSGDLRSVTVRRIVVGPSPIGNLVAIERVLKFDLGLYFIEDLQSKIAKRAGAGGYGTTTIKPETLMSTKSAVMFPVGPAALWVDMSHVDIQDAFREHIKRCKFAERMATRMCERNAFASHPAIARRHVEPHAGVATVMVFGGKRVVDEEKIKELIDVFEEGDFESGSTKGVEVVTAQEVDTPELDEVLSEETEEGEL